MELFQLALAFILAALLMFFGAVAGGVGMLLRPLLIFIGIPPVSAISAPRIGAIAGELPGLTVLHQKKTIDWRLALAMTLPLTIGAVVANYIITELPAEALRNIMATILVVIGCIFVFYKSEPALPKHKPTKMQTVFAHVGYAITSFFGSFTGGVGPVLTFITMKVYRKNLIVSAATWRIAVYIASTLGSVVFVVRGVVDWTLVVVLALSLGLGSYTGTHYAIRKGEQWTRVVIIILVFVSAIVLFLR